MAREKTDRRLAAIFCADVGTSIGSAALALARWPGPGREDLEHPILFRTGGECYHLRAAPWADLRNPIGRRAAFTLSATLQNP